MTPNKPARDREVYEQYLDFHSLVKSNDVAPNWLDDGSRFWFCHGQLRAASVLLVDPFSRSVAPLLDASRLLNALTQFGLTDIDSAVSFSSLCCRSPERVTFELPGDSYIYELDLRNYGVVRSAKPSRYGYGELVVSELERDTPKSYRRMKFWASGRFEFALEAPSPDGAWYASVQDWNCVLRSRFDGHDMLVTYDGCERNFWDVDRSLWNPWSPNGELLVLFKHDVSAMPRNAVVEWLKYPRQVRYTIGFNAGGPLPLSEVHIFDVPSRKILRAHIEPDRDSYLRALGWLDDSRSFIAARYSRSFDRVTLLRIDALSGETSELFTEKSETFVVHPSSVLWGTRTGFTLLPDGGFLWVSDRTGWRHIYRYRKDGSLEGQLTDGAWPVHDVVHVDSASGTVYFTGSDDFSRPYDNHLYAVSFKGSGLRRLTTAPGQHELQLSPSGKFYLDRHSALDAPPRTILYGLNGDSVTQISSANVGALERLGWKPPIECVVKAADGTTDLWATLYLPYDFDPQKMYPLVQYIYGGPQSAVRPTRFMDSPDPDWARPGNFNRALANLGFVVAVVDGRGTPGRSKIFQDVICSQWADGVIDDYPGAVQQLAVMHPFIDITRVGIWGWSWGGQFAFRAMCRAPDLYKAGVCAWPVFDLMRMAMYEAYLGSPQQNSALYRQYNTFDLAGRLKGELLLTGSMSDPGIADLFQLSERLIRLGKQHQVMIYPNAGHGAVGKTSEYDMELKAQFFLTKLGSNDRTE